MANRAFRDIIRLAGIAPGRLQRPRIHDLRHTFATQVMEQCGTGRETVARHAVALMTYMGHTGLRYTYWRRAAAAKRFFRKLLKGLRYIPRVIVTDQLKSYAAAKREILPSVEHRQSRYLNTRAEVSHQPTRRRERQMQRFKSARQAQRFLSTHSRSHNHFQRRRHHLRANQYRAARDAAFRTWRDVGDVAPAV